MNTKRITTEIAQAADAIRAGQLVAVPTETVYGLAGNGLDPAAVAQIYEVKGRPSVKPLSLMVHDASAMARYCADVPPAAYMLAEAFWPGPLTIVLRAQDCVPEIVRAGGQTVGLRCPDHPATLALIEAAQLPLAAPSANPSGAPSPKTADDVLAYFNGQIAAVIDGGPCGIGRESTLVDLSHTPYRILRSAAVPDDAVWDALVRKMHIVGITGGTGCGKTTALMELERQGALVIDCDAVYHELLASNTAMLAEINARFPRAWRYWTPAKAARRGRVRGRGGARRPQRHHAPVCPCRGARSPARVGAAGRHGRGDRRHRAHRERAGGAVHCHHRRDGAA